MTLSDYMSAERFPRTTQAGLAAVQQLRIDAFNHDQLREFLEEGGRPTEQQRAAWRELEEKLAQQPRLLRELREQKERATQGAAAWLRADRRGADREGNG
jgi:hypothetical protein